MQRASTKHAQSLLNQDLKDQNNQLILENRKRAYLYYCSGQLPIMNRRGFWSEEAIFSLDIMKDYL